MRLADDVILILRQFRTDERGQDLVEYALVTGLVAVTAGSFFPPNLMPAVSTIFSKICSSMNAS